MPQVMLLLQKDVIIIQSIHDFHIIGQKSFFDSEGRTNGAGTIQVKDNQTTTSIKSEVSKKYINVRKYQSRARFEAVRVDISKHMIPISGYLPQNFNTKRVMGNFPFIML